MIRTTRTYDTNIERAYGELRYLESQGLFNSKGKIQECFLHIFLGWCRHTFENGKEVYLGAMEMYNDYFISKEALK